METKMSILFYGKKGKTTREKLLPIYLRVTINGERFEVSTKRYIEKNKWSIEAGCAKGGSEEARSVNTHLDILKQKVYDYQQTIMQEKLPFSAEMLRLQWFGINEQSYYLVDVFKKHNEQMRQLIGLDCSKATVGKFNTTLLHISNFLSSIYQLEDIDLKKLDYKFISDFEFWLKSHKKCNHNTTIKYLSNLRKIVFGCIKNGWLVKDPFYGLKMNKKPVSRDYLTEDEIQRLISKDFNNDRLNQVRDIFIFSCFTGLAYVDAKRLKRTDIGIGIDNERWIFTRRKKTDTATRIPLLPTVLDLINKYQNHPKCNNEGSLLPVPSNQKLNSYLKEIADICSIMKHLTFHIARHTFATTITLNNGVPIETVSKMLGHKSLKITQIYAKILDRKVSDDMKLLRTRLNM